MLSLKTDNSIALIFGRKQYSWKQLFQSIINWKSILEKEFSDLNDDDLILIFLDNRIEFVSIFYSVIFHKGIFFPVDTNLTTDNIYSLIKKNKIKFLITENKYSGAFKKVDCKCIIADTYKIKSYPSGQLKLTRKADSRVICQLTSGSTGTSKPVFRTYSDLLEECSSVSDRLKLIKTDILFCPLKLSHSYALTTCLTAIMYSGGTFAGLNQFTPYEFQCLLNKKITILAENPYLFELICRLSKKRKFNMKNIRLFISAGAPLPENTLNKFQNIFKKDISQLYGMTETGAASINYPVHVKELFSCGKPFLHIKIIISKKGLIEVHKRTGITKTKDLGKWSQENNLVVSGRNDTLIELNGKKLNSTEIKKVINKYPAISDVRIYKCVVKEKEILKAQIVSSKKILSCELFDFCLTKLPRYMIPSIFLRVRKFAEKRLV